MVILWLALASGPGWAAGLFPEIPGWNRHGEIQRYTPDNVFDAINGAADLYLAYGLEALQTAEYRGPGMASVLVEVYTHGTPRQAFGVYSRERVPQGRYMEVGAQAYVDEGSGFAGIVKGSHYVRVAGSDLGPGGGQVLETFVREIAGQLPGEAALPALLAAFPGEGKVPHSEIYVDRNVLGYPFFQAGFLADYTVDGAQFRLVALEAADPAAAEAMLSAYVAQLGPKDGGGGTEPVTLEDPNHGAVALLRKGRFLAGVLGAAAPGLRNSYLHRLTANLPP
jgi:hypothetical protein